MSRLVSVSGLGSRGFSIEGAGAFDFAGWSVSDAGDVNGDGFDDIIVGAPYADVPATNSGAAYVIYGHAGGLSDIHLANLSANQGFAIQATRNGGLSVSSAGDVNGDGFDDVIVATYTTRNATAYVVLGKAAQAGPVDLAHLAASDGFGIKLTESSYYPTFAMNVASAGDVNGDGFDDLIVGSFYANSDKGAAYVIFGKANGFADVDLGNLSATQGFAILGSAPSNLTGGSVSGAGDINGDGFDDVIVGASNGGSGGEQSGQAYVIFGKADGFGTIDLGNLSGTAGFMIQGDSANDAAGFSVSNAGDVNGDGFDDIIVGAPFDYNAGGDRAGIAYVIFGKQTGFANIDLTNLGAAGFSIHGAAGGDDFGYRVSSAGDVNRDGLDDILVMALRSDANGTDTGTAYVIFGKTGGFDAINLGNLSPSDGFIVEGFSAKVGFGTAASGAGDFNGDGFADIVIGAPYDSASGGNRAFVVSSRTLVETAHNDFNGDGRSDVLWQNDDRTVRDWLGQNPNGNFAANIPNVNFVAGPGSHMIGTGDFNGDGRADILCQSADGRVTDLLGQTNGGFIDNYAKVNIFTGLEWHAIGTGDFNGDGIDDVLWQHNNGTIREWLGQADGTFVGNITHVNFVGGAGSRVAGTGDFNGDGRADLLCQSADGRITDLLGQAGGGFIDNYAKVNIFTGLEWHVIGTGDFNGDGRDDVLLRHDNGTIREWLGQADDTFAGNIAHVNFVPASGSHIVAIGDYNGDSRADILWANNGTVTQSLGQTDGSFIDNSAQVNVQTGTEWHAQDPFVHDWFG